MNMGTQHAHYGWISSSFLMYHSMLEYFYAVTLLAIAASACYICVWFTCALWIIRYIYAYVMCAIQVVYIVNSSSLVHHESSAVSTMKPVYKDHSRDQVIMVFIDRWSLCRGVTVLIYWFLDLSRVVFIDRWSLCRGATVLIEWFLDLSRVVFINRWSLCRGATVLIEWFLDLSRVVFIDRWSFYTSDF